MGILSSKKFWYANSNMIYNRGKRKKYTKLNFPRLSKAGTRVSQLDFSSHDDTKFNPPVCRPNDSLEQYVMG